MKYRISRLLPALTLPAVAGTHTLDLNVAEPISRIELRYKVTKSLAYMTAHPAADIIKIELVDGSDVLFALSGYECQALCIYDRRTPSMCHGQHTLDNSEESSYGLDFGRYLWDPEFALVPSRFRNPQLRISYNSRLCDTGATVPTLEIFAYIFDERQISPVGFMLSKEHYKAACPAVDSYKYVELPGDFPIRQLLVRGFHSGHEVWDSVKAVRLDEENEKRVPFDWDTEEYHRLMKGSWQQIQEQFIILPADADENYYVTPSAFYTAVCGAGTILATPLTIGGWPTGGLVNVAGCPAMSMSGMVMGYLPNHTIQFPFGDQQDKDAWYDVQKLGSARLRITGGDSGVDGAFQVVLQQLRSY